jgi:hypothetical protein
MNQPQQTALFGILRKRHGRILLQFAVAGAIANGRSGA